MEYLIPFICAYLYRLGGGDIFPFKRGWKPARRYLLPLLLAIYTSEIIPIIVLCIILHYNLDEIEEKDWDDVSCYGLAQAWCLYPMAGIWSGVVGLWWIVGVLWSNLANEKFKLKWHYVELIHGFLIGFFVFLN